MAPSLREGARVLVTSFGRKRVGDIIVFPLPHYPETQTIKRIISMDETGLVVEGDNLTRSTDSRHYGTISKDVVIGKVQFQYYPKFRWYI
ncbi:MAG: hypothetical protein MAGBODY4_01417 [Candidatus Marinimicrobia bacterium]|nr:hypothetical protein [Candidatus Neomarinimicrobiota bacterium]